MSSRAAAVAGFFYPKDPSVLAKSIDHMLENKSLTKTLSSDSPVKALVVPHAGYRYSGQIAAAAYQQLKQGQFKRVLLLGPNHRVPLQGIAAPSVDSFQSPLGELALDTQAIKRATQSTAVGYSDRVHQDEHCLEVQLPFILQTLGPVPIVPLVVGRSSAKQVCELISSLMTTDTLLLISTDLSHFHPLAETEQLDKQTVEQIIALQPKLVSAQACGAAPLNGALLWAQQQGLSASLLAQGTSVDGGGDPSSVVGYVSIALH